MARPYDLSSMTALICFETAARYASFKMAARELNVTPAAVSHQIKALEVDLGCLLFERQYRGVELTEKGAILFIAIGRGLQTISEAVTQLRGRPQTVDATIGTTTAISSLWLTPKITAFWKIHPDITVSQIVSDVPGMDSRCDLNIHYGNPSDDGAEHHRLFQDHIVALGTRHFADGHGISQLDDLLQVPLIHSSPEETGWTTWTDWLRSLTRPAPKGRGFFVNNYMIALQAAQDHVGAVLGWDGLVAGLMKDEKLIQIVPDRIASPMAFYLRIDPRASQKARLFAQWLVESSR